MTSKNDPRGDRVQQIIAHYLSAITDSKALTRNELIAQHPDLESELRSYFREHDKLQRTALENPGKTTPPPASMASDKATILPMTPQSDQSTVGNGTAEIPHVETGEHEFGDFVLLEEIARGGMGVVYKARQVILNRTVALKMILAGQLASKEDVTRFHAEAEAAANLDHPGIVPIHEVGEHDGQHFFSMGFVDGTSLAEQLAAGPLSPTEAAEVTKKVTEAVAHAHGQGVIHRDLKPANVLLDRDGQPKLTDFGIAKRVEGGSAITRSGQILGTPLFMSPEQAAGKTDEITESTDIYSLGAMLYALITGRPPFQADNDLDTILQVIEQEPVPPSQLNPKVPQDLETICLKCLRKDRSRRYGTAGELASDLHCWLSDLPIKARPVGRVERCWRWCRRNPFRTGLWTMATLLLITVLVSTVLLANSSNQKQIALAQRDEQERQARVSREESVLLTHVVRNGNEIDNRFVHYEGPLEDLAASVTKVLAQLPPDEEPIYLAADIDSREGPTPHDLSHSSAHGKMVSIEYGTVAGVGVSSAQEQSLRKIMNLRHDFRRVFARTMNPSHGDNRNPIAAGELRDYLNENMRSIGVPWIYYSQPDGIHYGYPGKGGYGPDYDPRQRPFYKPFLAPHPPRDLTWGEVYWDRQGLGLLIPCCEAIFDEDNHMSGVVGFDVRVNTIGNLLSIALPYVNKSYLVDKDWNVLMDSEITGMDSDWTAKPFPFTQVVQESKQRGSWLSKTDVAPRKYLAVFPLHVQGWHYVVEADLDRLTAAALKDAPDQGSMAD